jgi:hypothetical protein
VAVAEAVVQAEEDERVGEALLVINRRAQRRRLQEEAWALAAAMTAQQEKEVMEVAEDTARQVVALLQSQSTYGPRMRRSTPQSVWVGPLESLFLIFLCA